MHKLWRTGKKHPQMRAFTVHVLEVTVRNWYCMQVGRNFIVCGRRFPMVVSLSQVGYYFVCCQALVSQWSNVSFEHKWALFCLLAGVFLPMVERMVRAVILLVHKVYNFFGQRGDSLDAGVALGSPTEAPTPPSPTLRGPNLTARSTAIPTTKCSKAASSPAFLNGRTRLFAKLPQLHQIRTHEGVAALVFVFG
jgi:hypothetical protein